MKKIIFLFLIFCMILTSGCKEKCETGKYTDEGKCCTYVCKLYCENGYEEGTCGCQCKGASNDGDMNIDGIFDDSGNVEPPAIPN